MLHRTLVTVRNGAVDARFDGRHDEPRASRLRASPARADSA
jgi:hypothetical protein